MIRKLTEAFPSMRGRMVTIEWEDAQFIEHTLELSVAEDGGAVISGYGNRDRSETCPCGARLREGYDFREHAKRVHGVEICHSPAESSSCEDARSKLKALAGGAS